jgi:cell division protein FtsI/penicillin-binding protein 2
VNDHNLKDIPDKANKILYAILLIFAAFLLRIWLLQFHEYEEKKIEARKPGKKTEILHANRATIRDRYNEPFSLNKLNYELSIVYSEMKEIPSTIWIKDEKGNKVKKQLRKEYIKNLSHLLHRHLGLDPERLQDEIHAKASLFNSLPYSIKSHISEEQYLKLNLLSFFWPGLHVERKATRVYPQGKLASHVIGAMGIISKEEYEGRLLEREELKLFLEALDLGADLPLPEPHTSLSDVKRRIRELDELAYTSKETVGKWGIEGQFEEVLRGKRGKITAQYDNKGHLVLNYPGSRVAKSGERLLLSLSKELQDEAERLLVLSEETRETKVKIDEKGTIKAEKTPFIKGGAIVAMDPNTGEILAFASYPGFDPNIFSESSDKRSQQLEIKRVLEDTNSIDAIWNGIIPLKRERYNHKADEVYEENLPLTWSLFLDLILNPSGPVKKEILEITNLEQAFKTLNKAGLNPYVSDLILLNVDPEKFTLSLKKKVSKISLEDYRLHEQAYIQIEEAVKEKARLVFRDVNFKKWREDNEKSFIATKRQIEKDLKKYPKPYLDYLDEEEKLQFDHFWQERRASLILSFLKEIKEQDEFSETLKLFREEILKGAHTDHYVRVPFLNLNKVIEKLSWEESEDYIRTFRTLAERTTTVKAPWRLKGKKDHTLKDLAQSFYPVYGYGYLRSHAFRQSTLQGSIFKLVTAYTALKQDPHASFEIRDQIFKSGSNLYVGYDRNGKAIPQLYKGGRIPRSSQNHLGQLDLVTAIEKSSNPYFALLAMDFIKHPNDLIESAKQFSFGEKTGIELPGEISGKLPKDLETNPTGLYATAIGQHTLVVTPLQTTVFLSSIANKGRLLKPQILKCRAGKSSTELDEIPELARYPLDSALNLAGIDFPLFTPLIDLDSINPVVFTKPELKRSVYMPDPIRRILLEGMKRVVNKTISDSLFQLSKIYNAHPELIASFIDVRPTLVGKTSTSESLERLNLDEPNERPLYTHVWFGGLSFEDEYLRKPELVVVVYLRYGGYGKEAAPIAAQLIKKYREIKGSRGN